MDSKKMKNIKPTYAVKLGKGVFAGAMRTYQCINCGYTTSQGGGSGKPPSPNNGVKCNGEWKPHIWIQIS